MMTGDNCKGHQMPGISQGGKETGLYYVDSISLERVPAGVPSTRTRGPLALHCCRMSATVLLRVLVTWALDSNVECVFVLYYVSYMLSI